jgi:hypothetical protein
MTFHESLTGKFLPMCALVSSFAFIVVIVLQ